MSLTSRYNAWYVKLSKNLHCSKGQGGAVLSSRVELLKLKEGLLGGREHSRILKSIVTDFSEDRKNLRWVQKLMNECERWDKTFEATLRVTSIPEKDVLEALVEGSIDIDLAVGLTNG